MSTKRNKSNIWQYFEKVEEKISRCKLCLQECRTAGNTSNLWDHFKRRHTTVYIDNAEGATDSPIQMLESTRKAIKMDPGGSSKPPARKKPRKTICPVNTDQLLEKNIIPLPGGRSEVWKRKLFGFYSNDGKTIPDKQRAVCCQCFSEIPYSGNTTNLGIHLAKKHPDMYQLMKSELEEMGKSAPASIKPASIPRASSLGNAVIINTLMPRGGARAANISEAVASFIIRDLHSINVADDDGFRQLLHVLEPRYEALACNTLTEVLQNRKEAISTVLLDKLTEVEACALVTDCWSADNGRNYCTLMVRFVDQDWQVQTYVLKTLEITWEQSYANHIWDMNKVLADWTLMPRIVCHQTMETQTGADDGSTASFSIENPVITVEVSQMKVVAAVTNDNGNVALALKHLGFSSIPCFVNVVNEAVNAGINSESANEIIAKARRLVGHFNRYNKDKLLIGKKIDDDELALQTSELSMDMSSRWTSTTEMISRLLELKGPLCAALNESKDRNIRDLNLTGDEWCQLEILHGAMKGFSIAIGVLGGEDAAPCSMVTPLLHRQKDKFTKITEETTPAVFHYNKTVWENLDPHYGDQDVQAFFNIATFLDPRFKDMVDLSESMRLEVTRSIRQMILDMEENHQGLLGTSREDLNEAVSPSKRVRQRMQELDLLFGTVEDKELNSGLITGNDLDRYLQEATIGIKESPLEWWDKNGHRFPNLSKVAKRYLCVPATATPSDHVLSQEGSLFYNRRKRLTADEVDLMVFLNKNLNLIG